MSTPRGPVEAALEEAIARGDFDDLPGAGKPLDLPDTHDPDWWIKQRLAGDDVDRDALLPPVVLLRREFERRDETLSELQDEQAVRDYAADFTERVHQDRRDNPFQHLLAPAWDEDDAVERWRALRARREAARRAEAPAAPPPPARPRRPWWRFGRRA